MQPSIKKQILQVLVAVFVTSVLVRVFLIDSFIVQGDSMAPTILPNDYVFINRLAYINGKSLERGDIVVARFRRLGDRVIKRVIGLPGERLEIIPDKITVKKDRQDVGLTINEKSYLNLPNFATNGTTTIKLDPGEYFLLGDNRFISTDSRDLGPTDRWDIEGKVTFLLRVKPLTFRHFNRSNVTKVY